MDDQPDQDPPGETLKCWLEDVTTDEYRDPGRCANSGCVQTGTISVMVHHADDGKTRRKRYCPAHAGWAIEQGFRDGTIDVFPARRADAVTVLRRSGSAGVRSVSPTASQPKVSGDRLPLQVGRRRE